MTSQIDLCSRCRTPKSPRRIAYHQYLRAPSPTGHRELTHAPSPRTALLALGAVTVLGLTGCSAIADGTVIPEKAGPCQGSRLRGFGSMRAAPGEGRGQTQRPQRERGRMVLTVARPGADWNEPVNRSRTNDAIRFRYVVVVQRLQCDACGVGQGRASSAAGHPFARGCGHGAVRWQYAGSIRSATTPYGGQT